MYEKDCPKMRGRPAPFVDCNQVGNTKFYGNGKMKSDSKWIPKTDSKPWGKNGRC